MQAIFTIYPSSSGLTTVRNTPVQTKIADRLHGEGGVRLAVLTVQHINGR